MSVVKLLEKERRAPSRVISAVIFVSFVALTAWLRLALFPHAFLTLSYSMLLLVCLLHRDKLLLWSMAGAFAAISTIKTFLFYPTSIWFDYAQWAMQLFNIFATAAIVHLILLLAARLHSKNAALEQTNAELAAREEEITRQNEELQAQSEEMAQQNEELEHQAEELQAQGEELQSLNAELAERQSLVEGVLTSLRNADDERSIVHTICENLARLLGPDVTMVAVVEKAGEDVVVQTWAGDGGPMDEHWPFANSFTAIVMQQGRTASVDLEQRPDLTPPGTRRGPMRSILATPLKRKKGITGAVKACSIMQREWTGEQFRLIEWVAAQCGMALDILSLRRELEHVNQNLESTVKQRTAELQEMVDELEHFSYTITHDMRAPLRAVQGFAGLLQESSPSLNPEAQSCLDHITRSVQRMDKLITDALSYSKAVRQELEAEPVDTRELLRSIVYSYPALQPPKARIEIPDTLLNVLGNEAGLTQCFSNLLTNAVKFVAPGVTPHIRIRSERRDGYARLWFEDNGIGISPNAQKNIFKMFQRGSREFEGTGIGLALVRKVASRMGGRVGVVSNSGQGSRFWLELPVAPEKPVQPAGSMPNLHSIN